MERIAPDQELILKLFFLHANISTYAFCYNSATRKSIIPLDEDGLVAGGSIHSD